MLKPVLCCSCNAKNINKTSLHHSNESHTIKHLKVYSHKFTQDRSMFPVQIERKNFGTKAKNKVENYKHTNFKISGCHGKGSFQDKSIQTQGHRRESTQTKFPTSKIPSLKEKSSTQTNTKFRSSQHTSHQTSGRPFCQTNQKNTLDRIFPRKFRPPRPPHKTKKNSSR